MEIFEKLYQTFTTIGIFFLLVGILSIIMDPYSTTGWAQKTFNFSFCVVVIMALSALLTFIASIWV